MKIALGSLSEQKAGIAERALRVFGASQIVGVDVSSGVTDQPLDERTTIEGALNRARRALGMHPDASAGLGLEAGLVDIDGVFNLLCVAAVVTPAQVTSIGKNSKMIPLPRIVSDDVRSGKQFGEEIRAYLKDNKTKMDMGEIALIEELINREQSFESAIVDAFLKLPGLKS